jgi:hypothetical protein
MKYTLLVAFAFITAALAQQPASAHEHGHSSSGVHGAVVQSHRRAAPRTVPSGPRRRTVRSRAARADFQREHPCPATGRTSGACHGYVVDHIQPLACESARKSGVWLWGLCGIA